MRECGCRTRSAFPRTCSSSIGRSAAGAGVPGKAPKPWSPEDISKIFANKAPQMIAPPQATRYQSRLGQFTNQAHYRMPMQGLGSIMMRRR